MKIFITAKPRANEERIEKVDDSRFKVAVKEPPVKGVANEAIAKALAEYFGVSRSQVRLMTGFSSRQKMFEIN